MSGNVTSGTGTAHATKKLPPTVPRCNRLQPPPAFVWMFVLLCLLARFSNYFVYPDHAAAPGSIYVPGGGFSTFWFNVGRLHSIPTETLASRELYCYSSGCLAAVAALGNYSRQEVLDKAAASQKRWQTGEIDFYDYAQDFVDTLLDPNGDAESLAAFRNVNILTARIRSNDQTGFFGSFGVVPEIRRASSLGELREMLIQTTYVPLITGPSLWKRDPMSGESHMDGAFAYLPSLPVIPKDSHALEVPWSLAFHLSFNSFNMNMSRRLAESFMNKGIEYGANF